MTFILAAVGAFAIGYTAGYLGALYVTARHRDVPARALAYAHAGRSRVNGPEARPVKAAARVPTRPTGGRS